MFNIIVYFLFVDHQNFFGIDENVGPIAISLKREKVDERDSVGSRGEGASGLYQYRVIVRTSEVSHQLGRGYRNISIYGVIMIVLPNYHGGDRTHGSLAYEVNALAI